jgi:hypothetical protein
MKKCSNICFVISFWNFHLYLETVYAMICKQQIYVYLWAISLASSVVAEHLQEQE